MSQRLVFPLPAALTSPSVARHEVSRSLGPYLQDRSFASAIEVIVSELVSNAVCHSVAPIRLELVMNRDQVLIEVFDGDGRIENVALPIPGEHLTSGRGMLLVEHLASSWGVQASASGKSVWARLERVASQTSP